MNQLPTRSETPENSKWRLEDIFASNTEWEREFEEVSAAIPTLGALKETITSSAAALASGLKTLDETAHKAERLYVYARMRRDEDNAKAEYQALADRASSLLVRLSSEISWLAPTLLSLPDETLQAYLQDPALSEHRFMLKDLLREKSHILPEAQERLLSMAGDFADGAKEVFTMLNNADLRFAPVQTEKGELPLSHATYSVLMQNPDRQIRGETYENYYRPYQDLVDTICAAYSTSVKKDVFYAKARGYKSSLAKALFSDDVPESVYTGLIESVHAGLPAMYRYIDLRAKLLGLRDQKMYDIYVPLVGGVEEKFNYERSCEMVKQAVVPLGSEYAKVLSGAFLEGWTDVYENRGKTSGAYSWGVYGVHPYVLLNHRDDLGSVFTIAHEMGHAMHSYFSNKTQPYATAGYAIFSAEVASTVNEILLTRQLLRETKDATLKKYVLNHYIDQFRTTVFRQTMFAEFEKISHEMAEGGDPLTPETLCAKYADLNRLYYGKGIETDATISFEWARIPHFYNAFYVYKYATGFSCACAIVKAIEEQGNVDGYLRFLSSGGSDYPIALLKNAGVNFDTAVDDCMAEFARALGEFEKMML